MANFAFVTWDGGGNVGPAIGIAQALAARGHRSHFFGYARQAGRFEAAGLAFSTLGRNGDFDVHAVPPEQRLAALLRHVWACPEHLQDLPAALDGFPADLMLVDFLMQGALAFAPRSAIPVAALIHSAIAGLVPPPQSPVGAVRLTAVNDLRVSAGLPSIGRLNDAWDRLLALVTTVAALDPAATEAAPSVHYVGPIVEPSAQPWHSPWAPTDRRPLVLVSFSTTGFWDQGGRVRNTLAALAEEPVRVLVSATQANLVTALPANAVACNFVPHARVLPEVAVTICHCGHGTVAASLAHGVPVVGLPNQAADQPFLARRVQELGAGLALDGEAQPAEIRAAVRKVLADPSYVVAARTVAAAMSVSIGPTGAASLLEAALQDGAAA